MRALVAYFLGEQVARGFAGVREVIGEQQRRASASSAPSQFVPRFRIPDGHSAIVRFLEQGDDVVWAWGCQLPPRPPRTWGDWTPSLDQKRDGSTPCPLIEHGYQPIFRGFINLIWRNAPVYERDANGRMVRDANNNFVQIGNEDQVFVWESGIKVFTTLEHIDSTYKGLMSRDFKVTRRGAKLQTSYAIDPADPDGGPQPMTKSDMALAQNKHDLIPMVTPESYEEIEKMIAEAEGIAPPVSDTSPFMRRRSNEMDGNSNPFMAAAFA
jgi:hypothetical protein